MSAADAIYPYTGEEQGAPGADFQNLLGDSVKQAVVDIEAQIAGIEDQADSGWVDLVTFTSGWTATSGHPPRIRRVGDRVDIAGAMTRGAGGANVLTIPEGFRLGGTYIGTQFIAAVTQSNGVATELTINGTTHSLIVAYGTLGAGVVLPLTGSWFVN